MKVRFADRTTGVTLLVKHFHIEPFVFYLSRRIAELLLFLVLSFFGAITARAADVQKKTTTKKSFAQNEFK